MSFLQPEAQLEIILPKYLWIIIGHSKGSRHKPIRISWFMSFTAFVAVCSVVVYPIVGSLSPCFYMVFYITGFLKFIQPVSPNHSPTVVVFFAIPTTKKLATNRQTRGASVAQTLRALEPFVEQVTARLEVCGRKITSRSEKKK